MRKGVVSDKMLQGVEISIDLEIYLFVSSSIYLYKNMRT